MADKAKRVPLVARGICGGYSAPETDAEIRKEIRNGLESIVGKITADEIRYLRENPIQLAWLISGCEGHIARVLKRPKAVKSKSF